MVNFTTYYDPSPPSWEVMANFMVSYSELPTRDFFDKILNDIPCVNSARFSLIISPHQGINL